MNRNSNNHFAQVPQIDIQRSTFNINDNFKTTAVTGKLYPIMVREILPGDTFRINMSGVVRMLTPIFPVLDSLYIDTYFFYVPNRLTWQHWKEFVGENKDVYWEDPVEYTIPQIEMPEEGWQKGSLADAMALPTLVGNNSVSALPFRAYCLIWNNFFRASRLKQPADVNLDDATQQGLNPPETETDASYVNNTQFGGQILRAARFHDYFSSASDAPQVGPDTLLPIGGVSGELPVVGTGNTMGLMAGTNKETLGLQLSSTGGVYYSKNAYDIALNNGVGEGNISSQVATVGLTTDAEESGLVALTGQSTQNNSTISQLRMAFAIQRIAERLMVGGQRYNEILRSVFGVVAPDASLQIPEYLGGFRRAINIDQVLQTSATNEVSPQGNTAAYSLTGFHENVFTKSFTEHGYLLGLAVVRTANSYQQGIDKMWSRKSIWDFYWPQFAHLSEAPIYNKELYAQGTDEDEEVFGYQEAWAEYRYGQSKVAGALRSNYAQSLDAWHYADYYTSLPTLSSEWIDATDKNVERTLAVSSELEDQFLMDFSFNIKATRPMPLYSVPGLIDHY